MRAGPGIGRTRSRRAERGLTLVEVVCALVVLAIGITAAFRMLGVQSRHALSEQERVISHWVALNALEERRMTGLSPSPVVEMGGVAWRLEERLDPGPFGLVRVQVRAAAADRAGAVVTGYLRPPDEEPGE